MNGVAAAVATVDYDAWARHPDGTWIPQTSAPEVIQAMLELLDPCPGQRLLEVGAGSGYSAALLAQVLGPQGRLVSLDVDPGLVERAQRLHRQAGHGQVEVHRADGFGGWPSAAPFEGIVAWATPHLLPRAWVEQTAVGGTIVTPVEIARVAAANAVLCCRVADGEPGEATLHPGSFVEMAPEVITSPGTPIRHVDAVRLRGDGAATWISGHRLHGQPPEALEPLLNALESAASEPGFLDPEGVEAFTAFVLAAAADPASAGTPDDYGLGVATPGGSRLCSMTGRCWPPARPRPEAGWSGSGTAGSSWASPATGTSSPPSLPARKAGSSVPCTARHADDRCEGETDRSQPGKGAGRCAVDPRLPHHRVAAPRHARIHP